MTPHEINTIKDQLFPALELLGWERYEGDVSHERDWDVSHIERGWKRDGKYIITDEDMSEGLALELIRLVEVMRGN